MVLALAALTALAQTGGAPERRLDPGGRPIGPEPRSDGTLDLAMLWSNGRAIGKGPVRFTYSPMRLDDIERIVPYGLMVGGHVCPIDHGYFYPKPLQPGQEHYDVLAPADSRSTSRSLTRP